MLAQDVVCSACRSSFKVESSPTGPAFVKCPFCGEPVLLDATVASEVAEPSAFPETASVVAGPGASDAPTDAFVRVPPAALPASDYSFLSPPQQPDELGRLGQYRVLSVLGAGGMGMVFRAQDPALRRQVALKVMLPRYANHPAAKARFLREARSQAAVEHNHIIAIHQVAEERDVAYITMPLLKGQTLADALKANSTVPVAESVRIAREMAEGLAAAHENGLIHRDIKPANVWLEGRSRQVKILDFGLARVETEEPDGLTQEGAIIGTPAYMSPEQTGGDLLDARTDLFSLGVVLYQMLTGRQPFVGKTTSSTLVAVTIHHPPRPSELNQSVPADLDSLTMRLLAKSPADRPTTAESVVEALHAVALGMGGTGPVPVVPADPWQSVAETEADAEPELAANQGAKPERIRRKRRPWVLVASLLAFIAVGAVAADIIIKIKNKDGTETEIKVPDGSTVTIVDKGKEVAKIGPKANPDVPADPDRKAAQWVLSVGGSIGLNGEVIKVFKELPREPFRLTQVNCRAIKFASEDLVVFRGCRNLNYLDLPQTQVSDASLANFRDCKNLLALDLSDTQIGDAGLAHFKDCKNLRSLVLNKTQITDIGLAIFKDCKDWIRIELNMTQVSDTGVAIFNNCRNLRGLNLGLTHVSDAGLINFRDCNKLENLIIGSKLITDAGLAYFKSSTNLNQLWISTNRCAARRGRRDFKSSTNLNQLWIRDSSITDAGLGHFKDCKQVKELVLTRSARITGEGLMHFRGCPLTYLSLGRTQVRDDALSFFKDCSDLDGLDMSDTPITSLGLSNFKTCQKLTTLGLGYARNVDDAGLAHFKNCKNLITLRLNYTQVSDASLAQIKEYKQLKELDLRKTKITPAGIDELKAALPQCRIVSEGGVVEPKSK